MKDGLTEAVEETGKVRDRLAAAIDDEARQTLRDLNDALLRERALRITLAILMRSLRPKSLRRRRLRAHAEEWAQGMFGDLPPRPLRDALQREVDRLLERKH